MTDTVVVLFLLDLFTNIRTFFHFAFFLKFLNALLFHMSYPSSETKRKGVKI